MRSQYKKVQQHQCKASVRVSQAAATTEDCSCWVGGAASSRVDRGNATGSASATILHTIKVIVVLITSNAAAQEVHQANQGSLQHEVETWQTYLPLHSSQLGSL